MTVTKVSSLENPIYRKLASNHIRHALHDGAELAVGFNLHGETTNVFQILNELPDGRYKKTIYIQDNMLIEEVEFSILMNSGRRYYVSKAKRLEIDGFHDTGSHISWKVFNAQSGSYADKEVKEVQDSKS